MKTKLLKIAKHFHKDYLVGKSYEIDDETAQAWLDAGLAVADNVESLVDSLTAALGGDGGADDDADAPADDSAADEAAEKAVHRVLSKVAQRRVAFKSKPAIRNPLVKEQDKSFGDFLKCVAKGRTDVLINKYRAKRADFETKTTSNEGTTTTGGFTVPVEYIAQLLFVEGYQNIWRNANVLTLNTNVAKIPTLDQTATPSGGTSAMYGGVSIGFVSEGTAPGSNSQPAFKQLSLNVNKLLATCQITRELLEDSMLTVEQIIGDQFTGATNNYLDYQVLHGSASSQLQGIIGYNATKNVPRSTTGEFNLIDAATMFAGLPASSRNSSSLIWVVSPMVLDQLITLEDKLGRVVWLPNMSAAGGFDMRLFGVPVLTHEQCPTLGQTGDVGLYDMSKYVLGLRADIEVAMSNEYAFTSDIVTFRFRMRLDGKPQLTAPITLADGISTVSPFITLSSATS